ncbi:MAG: alanine:cation symporter family protein, partial [Bacteroidaceae bacterium]|nr:alanine:cation symporter family protein [Bacteroidaceae bacterium]
MEYVLSVIDSIQNFLWTYVVITLLVGSAVYFTWCLRGVQFLQLRELLRLLFSSNNLEKNAQSNGKRHINSFQAFAVSLSSRVGTGNLAGVASAIAIGGPGAVFWMWVMALLGASTAFMESTLAQLYKRKGEDAFYGGPAYYMQYGLHRRWMGVLFAVFITFGFGIANQIVQSNTLCDALGTAWGFSPAYIAMILTVMTLFIIFGGIQRISRFSAIVVPIMAVGYLILTLVILALNIQHVPAMLKLIVNSAFGIEQATGGLVGMAILQGVKRGLFSNEAGEGSAPNAAATASTSHPAKQGML